jgi:putative oxidoreductase
MAGSAISSTRLYFPGFAGIYRAIQPLGYALMRFACGAVIVPHGYFKLFGSVAPLIAKNVLTPMGFMAPLAWVYWLGILELIGGAMLALGLFTRPVALMLAVEFAIITFGWLLPHGYFFTAPAGGYEFTLLLLILYVGILFRGSGNWALDRVIGLEF